MESDNQAILKELNKTLTITYSGEHSPELDDCLMECAKGEGFKFTGSGYDLRTNERDISFERRLQETPNSQ